MLDRTSLLRLNPQSARSLTLASSQIPRRRVLSILANAAYRASAQHPSSVKEERTRIRLTEDLAQEASVSLKAARRHSLPW